jgi:hypothetical protein
MPQTGRGVRADLPMGYTALLLSIWPTWAAFRWARHRRCRACRRMHHLCVDCGYNLAGLAGTRCPECGSEAQSALGQRPDV